jgi:hypothetical protein
MKKPPLMASRLQNSIAKTEATDGTAEVQIVFTDASAFSFQAVGGNAKPKVMGGPDSLAQEFAAGLNKYAFLAAGVQLAFGDGSSCNLNFGRVIGASSS